MAGFLENSWAGYQLDLSGLGLTSLPENLLNQIQELDVSDNKLTSLPENLPASLQYLYVSDNKLTSLPENLPDQLQYLDASKNRLTSLPENLPASLQKLDTSKNRLTSLPKRLPDRLQYLDASKNRLTSLPENLPGHLQQLNVSKNRLTSLPQKLPGHLQYLYASDNELTSLPLRLPDHLQELNVSGNQLTRLPENLSHYLQKLDVSHNQLTSLPQRLSRQLQSLDGSHNQLTSLPEHIATTLGPGCEITLEGNPIPEQVRNHFGAMFNTEGYQGPLIHFDRAGPAPDRPLANAVADWHDEGKEDVKTAWSAFSNEDGAAEFSRFLDRLRHTINYANLGFRQGVVAWLSDLAGNPKLRNDSFAVSVDATTSCQDRVSLTYNDMKKVRLVSDVENGQYDDHLGELIQLARGMYRLDQLEKIAREKVTSLNFNAVDETEDSVDETEDSVNETEDSVNESEDSVNESEDSVDESEDPVDEIEVYLAYQVKLREKLKLPLDTLDMLYFASSMVTDDDLAQAEAQVKADENAHFINYLSTDWKPWQVVAERLDNTGFEETQEKVLAHIEESFEAQRNAGYAELDRKIDDASHRLEQLREALPNGMPEADVQATLEPIEQEREGYQRQVRDLPAKLNKDMAYPIKAEAARALLQERGLPLSLLDPQW